MQLCRRFFAVFRTTNKKVCEDTDLGYGFFNPRRFSKPVRVG